MILICVYVFVIVIVKSSSCPVQDELKSTLERLANEDKSFTQDEVSYNPVVNIMIEPGNNNNNIALYFNGSDYRYYVHVNPTTRRLDPYPVKLPIPDPDDWKCHLQFTNSYHTPGSNVASPEPPTAAAVQQGATQSSSVQNGHPAEVRKVKRKKMMCKAS